MQDEVVQLRLKLRALRTLQEASMNITPHTNVMKLLGRVLQSALLCIGASDGSLMLVDDDSQELVFAVVHGQVKNNLVGHRIPLGTGIAGWVAENREPLVIPDVQRDSRFSTTVDQTFRFSTRSMVCVPVLDEERVKGVFQAINKFEDEPFNDADLATMCLAAQLATTAIVRAEAVAALQDT
ncbi:MAG: GAF domain-containing protein [Anaerolineales bacterium]|nr:GAF domain-containing protein [Anaerolineales bacterium]